MNPFNIKSGYQFYWHNIKAIFTDKQFAGWGRKRTGRFAAWCANTFGGSCTLYEDGFIRSIGLGVDDSPVFSVIEDDIGVYYDANQPSRLENLLNETDFEKLPGLVEQAGRAISQILELQISKYNLANDVPKNYFPCNEKRILVIAQTAGDASLKYGKGYQYSTQQILETAIAENPESKVYLKVHPDVIAGKKASDISIEWAQNHCEIIQDNFNPVSLLKYFEKVYTKTSQMGFEALLLGKQCVCFGVPFYAGWGVTDDRVKVLRRDRVLTVEQVFAAAYLLYPTYFNPLTQKKSDIFDVMDTIHRHKARHIKVLKHAFFFGFSRWKHSFMKPFFSEYSGSQLHFINPLFKKSRLALAFKEGLTHQPQNNSIYIWGKKSFPEVEVFANKNNISVCRVEDGFVRSNSLGSDLTQPYSLVIDCRGIYFDPSQVSDLEKILQTYDFASEPLLLKRAEKVIQHLVANKISKYNVYQNIQLDFPKDKKIILVPGQVEDDASIKYGASGMTNLKLLQQVRQNCPNDYIVFKPHPDVLAGNRVGYVQESQALKYCNRVVTSVGIDSVLNYADEVHTLTSLVGFEGLLRQKKVFTYGQPFYAGWGLTQDQKTIERRARRLTLNELVAGSLLLYPQYIYPERHFLCEIEGVFEGLSAQKQSYDNSSFLRFKTRLRNVIVRLILKIVSRNS